MEFLRRKVSFESLPGRKVSIESLPRRKVSFESLPRERSALSPCREKKIKMKRKRGREGRREGGRWGQLHPASCPVYWGRLGKGDKRRGALPSCGEALRPPPGPVQAWLYTRCPISTTRPSRGVSGKHHAACPAAHWRDGTRTGATKLDTELVVAHTSTTQPARPRPNVHVPVLTLAKRRTSLANARTEYTG